VTRGDETVESAADKLGEASRRAGARGGLAAKLSRPLAEDSAFLRKLKPSLVKARLGGGTPPSEPAAPAGPQLGPRRPATPPNPLALVAAAFVAGIVLAKIIDWRGHAHPRD
jgi:hypothetical protein